ncbi:formimidoylglutamase [Gynurincola endophyticus]|jgi:formiminoglutamase|uniref:formimidoylglutamase n=1 Tax=Gynurincola endophyticus TaxID=2479004 RepID=UPI000F8DEC4C|nr:formimidoylglutamase [Gynurincola endophyticus]
MDNFQTFDKAGLSKYVRVRKFETKLGEHIDVPSSGDIDEALAASSAKFVIIGIPEDIGVRANYGVPGTGSCWESFLQNFLNIQSNEWTYAKDMLLLGAFQFADLFQVIEQYSKPDEERVAAYRQAVHTIDEAVYPIIKKIVAADKIPVVIGGGHNNAYPIIKGTAKGLKVADKVAKAEINAINLDAHLDFRSTEGRHSGNGFRYAFEEGFLQKYCAIGVQENYILQSNLIDFLKEKTLDFISFEDIFLQDKYTFEQAVAHAITFTKSNYVGIELDLDVIDKVMSSAYNPVGIAAFYARKYLVQVARFSTPAYLHLCEGIAKTQDGLQHKETGKLLSTLVIDFVKEMIGEQRS